MKKIMLTCLFISLLFFGCAKETGKDNPTAEDFVSLLESLNESASEKIVADIKTHPANNVSHSYSEGVSFNLCKTFEGELYKYRGEIYIFNNNQDASLKVADLERMRAETARQIKELNIGIYESNAIEQFLYRRNGNTVTVVYDHYPKEVANSFFGIIDSFLGDVEYKQLDTYDEATYQSLLEEINKKPVLIDTTSIIEQVKQAYEYKVEDTVQLCRKDLSQNVESINDEMLNLTDSPYYQLALEKWKDEYDLIVRDREVFLSECESRVSEIEKALANAEASPTREAYDKCNELISGTDISLAYYKDYTKDWNSRMAVLDKKIGSVIASYSGSGDDVVSLKEYSDKYVLYIKGNRNGHHFGITSYDSAGNYGELYVNTTDPYEGVTFDRNCSKNTTLEIKASGEWYIEQRSFESLDHISQGETYEGNGDNVIIVDSHGGTATIEGNHSEKHMGIVSYTQSGNYLDLLVNSTDPYSGKVLLRGSVGFVVVRAVGDWTFALN